MRIVAHNLYDAHKRIGTPIQLEHEVRRVTNDEDAARLKQAIAICRMTSVASAPMVAPDPLAFKKGQLELEAAYDRIYYVRASARVGERYARALERLDYYGYAEIEPLWPDDATKLADDLRQRGYDVEITRSYVNTWDVYGLQAIIVRKMEVVDGISVR